MTDAPGTDDAPTPGPGAVRPPSPLDTVVPLVALALLYGFAGFRVERLAPGPAQRAIAEESP